MKNKISLLGVSFSNLTEREVLEYIVKNLRKTVGKYYIVTPNPEILMIAKGNTEYKNVLNNAQLALPDGIGVIIAGKVLGVSFKERITGVDLLESICNVVSKQPITVGFLGAKEGVADKTAECLIKRYPSLKVSFTASELNSSSKMPVTDILFVAFGSPKQELWISENINSLPVKVIIGVGGAFDFISEEVERAPKWIRKIGLEWLFRLIIQPWRIKRQVSLVKFMFWVLAEKFKSLRF